MWWIIYSRKCSLVSEVLEQREQTTHRSHAKTERLPLQHTSSLSHRVSCRHAATFLWLNENSRPRPAALMRQHSAGSHAGNLSSSLVLYHSPSSSQSVQLNGLQEGPFHRLRLLVKHGPHGARASPQRSRYYNIISPTLCSHMLFSMGKHSREGKTPLRSDSHLNHALLKG